MQLPNKVKIVEVGPRDGLQNEPQPVPTNIKIDLINKLSATGLSTIEATSFVSPKWIPQMADSEEVFSKINKIQNIDYPVLVPNQQGMENAIKAGVKCIAVFTTSSETFCQKNTNCTIQESLQRISEVVKIADKNNIKVRGYISCVLGCPYEGEIDFTKTIDLVKQLRDLNCYEISLGDTIGIGTPLKSKQLVNLALKETGQSGLAMHFHDTYGQALANILASLQEGVTIFDSSITGLGGCPYAVGASGNVATEDVVYMLQGMGIDTGIHFDKLLQVSLFVSKILGHPIRSKVANASIFNLQPN